MSNIGLLREIKLENLTEGNLEKIFKNINDNFLALANSDYSKGEKGDSVIRKDEKLVNESYITDFGKKFLLKLFENQSIIDDLKDLLDTEEDVEINSLNNILEVIFSSEDIISFKNYIKVLNINCIYIVNTTDYQETENIFITSDIFYIKDLRINNLSDEGYKDIKYNFIDYSGIFWFTQKEDELICNKSDNMPYLSYVDDNWVWNYGGYTGILAQGPKGKDGEGAKIDIYRGIKEENKIIIKEKYNPSTKKWIGISGLTAGTLALIYEKKDNNELNDTEYVDVWFDEIIPNSDETQYYIDCTHNSSIYNCSKFLNAKDIFDNIGGESNDQKVFLPYFYYPNQGHAGRNDDDIKNNSFKIKNCIENNKEYVIISKSQNEGNTGTLQIEKFKEVNILDNVKIDKNCLNANNLSIKKGKTEKTDLDDNESIVNVEVLRQKTDEIIEKIDPKLENLNRKIKLPYDGFVPICEVGFGALLKNESGGNYFNEPYNITKFINGISINITEKSKYKIDDDINDINNNDIFKIKQDTKKEIYYINTIKHLTTLDKDLWCKYSDGRYAWEWYETYEDINKLKYVKIVIPLDSWYDDNDSYRISYSFEANQIKDRNEADEERDGHGTNWESCFPWRDKDFPIYPFAYISSTEDNNYIYINIIALNLADKNIPIKVTLYGKPKLYDE